MEVASPSAHMRGRDRGGPSIVLDITRESSWPAPPEATTTSRPRQQRWQHVLLDLPPGPAPTQDVDERSSSRSSSRRSWPGPALAPEGPTTTFLADQQRLHNLLAAEEDEYHASLAAARLRWRRERQAEALEASSDWLPLTEVQRRRMVNHRARRRRQEEVAAELAREAEVRSCSTATCDVLSGKW